MAYTYVDAFGRRHRYLKENYADSWRVHGNRYGEWNGTNYDYEAYVVLESGRVLYEISDFYHEAQRAWEWANGVEPGYSFLGGDFDLWEDATYGLWMNACGWREVYNDVNKFLTANPGWRCDVERKETLTPEDNPVSWALFRSLSKIGGLKPRSLGRKLVSELSAHAQVSP